MVTIAELRARHNKMTQKELAEKLGVYQETVSRWEKDITRISSKHLKKVCLLFNVSADDLLDINIDNKKISV